MIEIARKLAGGWLDGPWTLDALLASTRAARGRPLSRTIKRFVLGHYLELRERPHERTTARLVRVLSHDPLFERLVSIIGLERPVARAAAAAADSPAAWGGMHETAHPFGVPAIGSVTELAAWLRIHPRSLASLAELDRPRDHYRRCFRGTRLIEEPDPDLKRVQRRIGRDLLRDVPTHDAAHGFVPGRSVRTAVSQHAGQPVLFVADCRAFFPSVHHARVVSLFMMMGYPEPVAVALARLCTTRLPRSTRLPEGWGSGRSEATKSADLQRLYRRHLPQGAPSSPVLANLCAYRLDARLSGLAQSFGARYSRYADDLIVSGPRVLSGQRFQESVRAIVEAEGFQLHPDKTRAIPQSQRQQVLGIVLNERPVLARAERDQLKACLWNCVQHGPSTQDRDGVVDYRAHLAGRVAWARSIDEAHSAGLVRLFEQIDWSR